jgi:hypothetical protein
MVTTIYFRTRISQSLSGFTVQIQATRYKKLNHITWESDSLALILYYQSLIKKENPRDPRHIYPNPICLRYVMFHTSSPCILLLYPSPKIPNNRLFPVKIRRAGIAKSLEKLAEHGYLAVK